MLEKIKKLIVICIIIIIIIIATIIILKITKNTELIEEKEIIEGAYEYDTSKIKRVRNRSDYILVEKCAQRYYFNYSDLEFISNLLDGEYISLYNIDKEDVKSENSNKLLLDIANMYVAQIGESVNIYFINGNTIDMSNMNINNVELAVIIDSRNSCFSIISKNYLEKMNLLNINEKSKLHLKELNSVSKNTYNTFSYKYIDEQTYVTYLFENYLKRCVIDKNMAYSLLDSEYKEKKFGNIEEFNKYLHKNQNILNNHFMKKYIEYIPQINENDTTTYKLLSISSYKKAVNKENEQYICIDNYGNYYIFKETAPMKYTIILDTYTIDLPEFLESYNKANMQEKTALNIQKIVNALNDQDYKYVYSKLANSFKQENFKTLESFETYAKKTFGVDNKLEFLTYEKTNNYTIYKINLTNNNLVITKTIIMDIQEGTDFVFSFNVD